MPIGHGPRRYFAVRTAAFVLDTIAPLSVAYCGFTLLAQLYPHHPQLSSTFGFDFSRMGLMEIVVSVAITFYLAVEAGFYVYYRWQHAKLQTKASWAPLPKEERLKLFHRIFSEVDVKDVPSFMARWFMWAETKKQLTGTELEQLGRENIKEWIAWAFFSLPLEDAMRDPNVDTELDWMVDRVEKLTKTKFGPVRNENVSAIVLNYNEVQAHPKPFLMYFVVFILETCAFMCLRWFGFRRLSNEGYYGTKIDTPTFNNGNPESEAAKPIFTYWFRPPKITPIRRPQRRRHPQQDQAPVIYFHGIGGGIFCYSKFLYKIMRSNKSRAMFIVELPHVSMRLVPADMVPNMREAVREIEAMLHRHGYSSAHVVGHSLGSI
ncbi:hypothetical protein HK102_001151, partial [Quaeritorhiza haematococci]